MGHVGGGEIIGVHLVLELGHGGVDEEGWVGVTGAAPNYVRRGAVEGGSFRDDADGLGGRSEVGANVVEFLGLGTQGAFLNAAI